MNPKRYLDEDIKDFLQEFLENNNLNDSKIEEILNQVINRGFKSLSDKQQLIFIKVIDPYVTDQCPNCGDDIPWCEMSTAKHNGGRCSWCQQLKGEYDI